MQQQEKVRYFVSKVSPVAQKLKEQFEADGLSGGEQANIMMGMAVASCMAMGVDEQWAHDQLTESWAEIDKAFGALIRPNSPPTTAAE